MRRLARARYSWARLGSLKRLLLWALEFLRPRIPLGGSGCPSARRARRRSIPIPKLAALQPGRLFGPFKRISYEVRLFLKGLGGYSERYVLGSPRRGIYSRSLQGRQNGIPCFGGHTELDVTIAGCSPGAKPAEIASRSSYGDMMAVVSNPWLDALTLQHGKDFVYHGK